jgi:hypothetical protein
MPTTTATLADAIDARLPLLNPDDAADLDPILAAGATRFQTVADLITDTLPDLAERIDEAVTALPLATMQDLGILPRGYPDEPPWTPEIKTFATALHDLAAIVNRGALGSGAALAVRTQRAGRVLADFADAITLTQEAMEAEDDLGAHLDRATTAGRTLARHLREGIWE